MPEATVDARDPGADLADAQFAITSFSGWINNADTKAALLAAAEAVVVTAIAGQEDAFADALRNGGTVSLVALGCLAVTILGVVVTAVLLGLVLIPRTGSVPKSRFAWPHHAQMVTLGRHVPSEGPDDEAAVAAEGWHQASSLAAITERKFEYLKWALLTLGVTIACFLAWSGVSSFVPQPKPAASAGGASLASDAESHKLSCAATRPSNGQTTPRPVRWGAVRPTLLTDQASASGSSIGPWRMGGPAPSGVEVDGGGHVLVPPPS